MKKDILCFLLTCSISFCSAYASTSADISKPDKSDERTAILENEFIKAVFSSKGGKLKSLIFKPENIDLTWNSKNAISGALKDQFDSCYFKFRDLNYEVKLIKNTPDEASIQMTVKGEGEAWNFITVSKTFTLKKGESRLLCKLEITNQPESMGEFEFAYWSHNFLGTKNEKNTVFIPAENGIAKFEPNINNTNDFYRNTVRGWLAVSDKKGLGAVSVFDFQYIDTVYSWYCRSSLPLDTLEWRFLPVKLKAGETFKTNFALAAFKEMPSVGGAGLDGVGEILIPSELEPDSTFTAKISLEGFTDFEAELTVSLCVPSTGDIIKGNPEKISVKAAETKTFPVKMNSGKPGTKILTASISSGGKELFDIEKIVQIGDKKTPAALVPKVKKIVREENSEPWNMKLSENFITPHYKWAKPLAGGKLNVLFLLPAKGARDVVELSQRVDINAFFPTIFPSPFGMSWKTDTNPDRGTTGLKELDKIIKNQNYDLIMIGGDVIDPWEKNSMQWKNFPESLRNEILAKVKAGAGLVYINPSDLDENMESIISSLKPLKLQTVDLKGAPFFENADINAGKYGDGQIITINYKTPRKSALLTPHPGSRTGIPHSIRKYSCRFQEYQFAVLAKLMLYAAGRGSLIKDIDWNEKNLTLEVNKACGNGETVHLDIFDKYTQLVWGEKKKLEGEKLSFEIPDSLPCGKNFVHASVLDENGKVLDFGYITKDIKNICSIKDVQIEKKNIKAGDTIEGKILLSSPLPQNAELEIEIKDVSGRKIFYQKGISPDFKWNTQNAIKRLHEISSRILLNGNNIDEMRKRCNVKSAEKILKTFPFMLWGGCHQWPEYVIPYVCRQLSEFGFNLIYTGGFTDLETVKDMELSNTEVSSNGFAYCKYLHTRAGMDNWQKTHDKKYLIRPECLNNPASKEDALKYLDSCVENISPFGNEEVFQLGDEMSITLYQASWDICFSQYCLKDFRTWLKIEYGSLEALNKEWETQFKTWDEVQPMTRIEIITRNSPAPWADHREFMDLTFSSFLIAHKERVREKYHDALVGPTGVLNTPAVYGGDWNFWNMSKLDMLSAYGVPRIPLSFNRNKRLIMEYRGYNYTEAKSANSLWEGLFSGERGANHWCAQIYIRPDLQLPEVRKYYSDLIWELRNGLADLFYNSEKFTDAAVHYSQASLRANFLKAKKKDFYDNCLSYCYVLEDLGIGYRFVSWEEIENGVLDNFKVLILPESSALSEKETAEIKKFVMNGGTLIGDYEIGLLDKHCKKLQTASLDELFGIKQKGMGIEKLKSTALIDADYIGSRVETTSGKPQAFAELDGKKYPVLISNNYGKGKTIYLNFRPNYSSVRNIAKGDSFRTFMEKNLGIKRNMKIYQYGKEKSAIMCSEYRNGNSIYVGLLPAPPSGNWEKMNLDQLRQKSFPAEIELPEDRYLYDARRKKYLGYGKNFKTMLTPALGSVFASLSYKVESIELDCPEALEKGALLKSSATVKTNGQEPSHHVLLFELINPDAEKVSHYRRIVEANNGKGNFNIPLALNDASGKWKLRVTDTATGINSEKNFILK